MINGRRCGQALAFSLLLLMICTLAVVVNAQSQTTGVTEIKVTAKRFEFEPKTITVPKGKLVRLLITSTDVDHGFKIQELGIDRRIKPNVTTVVEFTPARAGRFTFACSVTCGQGHDDMMGELIVTEEQANAGMQVKFDDNEPGVVVVESAGERLRIDTRTKSVTRLEQAAPATQTLPQQTQGEAATEKKPAAAEPYDYRLVNVPTPKRVLQHSLNLYFTHRFSEPVRPIRMTDRDLLGLDSFAVSSFGLFYGITDRLYVSAYRSPICQRGLCKTIELGVGYHWLDESGRSPLALSTYASMEGDDNFRQNFTYNIQVMLARSVTKYVNLFFSPAVHLNANGQRRFNPRPEDFFPPVPQAADFQLGKHTGSFGFGVNGRIRPTVSLLFEYTPRVGFKLGQVRPLISDGRIIGFTNESEPEIGFGVEKDIGRHSFSLTFSNTQTTTTSRYNSSNLDLPPGKFIIGFNLYRRFLR